MGKGGRNKDKGNQPSTPVSDDDALLEAAIAENLRIKDEAAKTLTAHKEEAQQPDQKSSPAELPGKGLTREEIIRKLNAVPTFCILNADKSIVGMENPKGGEMCTWFLDPGEAKAWLVAAIRENPDVRGLHLGVTPLGIAFAFAAGWAPAQFIGEVRLQGNQALIDQMAPMLQEQLRAQGLEPGPWQVPVFVCHELQTTEMLPVFLSRATLDEAWTKSCRTKESAPVNLAVMDLRLLVHQMQTDAFAWRILKFISSADSVSLVHEAKALSSQVMEHLSQNSDMPPPLIDDSPADEVPMLLRSSDEQETEEFVHVAHPAPVPRNPTPSEAPPPS